MQPTGRTLCGCVQCRTRSSWAASPRSTGTGWPICAASTRSPSCSDTPNTCAIHGGKVKNDKIDSEKIAYLLRGGNFPLSYVYPAEHRATRDLMRRRSHYVRRRAEAMAHIRMLNMQYNRPPIEGSLDVKKNRQRLTEELPQRFPDTSEPDVSNRRPANDRQPRSTDRTTRTTPAAACQDQRPADLLSTAAAFQASARHWR